MITRASRLQPSLEAGVGVGVRSTVARRTVVSRRLLVAGALSSVAFAAALYVGLAREHGPAAAGVRLPVESRASLSSLPVAARGPVSAALGHDQAAYRINGLMARNPAQRFSARFGPAGVAIAAGSARFAISLKGFGRGEALRPLVVVAPVASANRVSYAHGSLREWWANGPLGLEQSFDISRRPAGAGALTLSLAVPAGARLDHGTLLLPGGLRYAGVNATDADGRRYARGCRYTTGLSSCGSLIAALGIRCGSTRSSSRRSCPLRRRLGRISGVLGCGSGDTAVVGAPHQRFPQPYRRAPTRIQERCMCSRWAPGGGPRPPS